MTTPSDLSRTISDPAPGDHLCCLYDTEDEYRALLIPFLHQGLERGERVVHVVDVHTQQDILSYLQDDGVDTERYLASGQLAIATADEVHLPDGVFDPDRIIAILQAEIERTLAQGYSALRGAGEMSWVLRGFTGL